MEQSYQRKTCRLCNSNKLELVMNLAPTPLGDKYVSPEQHADVQKTYPLDLYFCKSCCLLQLSYIIDPKIIYGDYLYETSISLGLVDHFEKYADEVLQLLKPNKGNLVIDIGSNDGSLLKFFQKRGMKVLGIEPAQSIAEKATESGVETLPTFFNNELAKKLKKERGPATIITANNVFANIDNLVEMLEGIKKLLDSNGVFVFETGYLAALIQNNLLDNIYHEHISYFSVIPLAKFFESHGMELFEIQMIPTKGGSIRGFVQLTGGPHKKSPSVSKAINFELNMKLDQSETFKEYAKLNDYIKKELHGLLLGIKSKGKTIAGYGASVGVTTLIYQFDFGDLIDFLVDDNPVKYNVLSPGLHIPVLPSHVIYEKKPDYILIFAWRYAEPIMKKHQKYLEQGGHFILPLPSIEIIPNKNKENGSVGNNMISWWRTKFGEEEIKRVSESICNEHISMGPVTEEFEKLLAEALDIPYVIATISGSMALLMALMALGIKRGDEVIVPNRTWIATAHAPLMLGAKVVLVDVQKDVPIMDVSQLEQKITSRTKAIMPTHLGGRSTDMEKVNKIAQENGLVVIEDACQAFLSKNKAGYMGTQSDIGCFSLSIAKLISTGQGGFVVTRNQDTYKKLKLIRTHGVADIINASYTDIGFNFRFTDIQASIGIEQLARIPEKIAHVKKVYAKYKSGIAKLPFLKLIPIDVSHGEIPLYVEVLCDKREELIDFLRSHGIQTRPFYPDLNEAKYLENYGDFLNSKVFGTQGLFLPCGPDQSLENVDNVINILNIYGKSL
ncbi:UDP-4-amino-4-deoxy-L-arabinose--oxoglutarate aminotransferase [uncultured archaeon]|nr:UDP-4-amino-4-deoxy-L-arabinose--oxoglutarate aminotransferase [uncultured archaeon]